MRLLLPLFLLTLAATKAQESEKDADKETLKQAPNDFLDLFDSSRRDRDVQTKTNLFFAFGWNQALGNGNGIGDDYTFWGSGIFEVGLDFSTKLSSENDLMRFNYGLSGQWQTLRIRGNREFQTLNDITSLEALNFNVDKSKFEQFTLIAPLHLEIGQREKREFDNGISRYEDDDSIVVGIGGYLGLSLTTSQFLEFERNGRDISNRLYNDFEMEDFVYGLSIYGGYGSAQIFMKYGLNSIFKDSPVDQQYASIGFRFR
ncbi:hypothetical protein [Nonlabens antarcticus]|uniref:hypothetical protein n=1 Tax=Nonlabens antarcticus TaxID=392714 RepID=UPI001E33E425|nr:hypothetical protein [Nonlabens antarcticus]